MPTSGSSPIPFAMPKERRFCTTINRATSTTIITSGLPPLFSILRLDWKPTEVKNSIMQRSLMVPSKSKSAFRAAWSASVSSDTSSPPDTGAGMHRRFNTGTERVKNIPRSRAITPTPAVIYISSVTLPITSIILFTQKYVKSQK